MSMGQRLFLEVVLAAWSQVGRAGSLALSIFSLSDV
jgi:hypothetical protein